VDRAVAPLGLTHAQYSLLASLHAVSERGERPSQRQLADFMGLKPIFLSKLVRGLEAAGYVARETDRADARAFRLKLTKSGLAVTLRARKIVRELDEKHTACLGGPNSALTKQFKQTLRLLLDQASQGGQH
jgi:DNA-binding MarR family transcriptional regulator